MHVVAQDFQICDMKNIWALSIKYRLDNKVNIVQFFFSLELRKKIKFLRLFLTDSSVQKAKWTTSLNTRKWFTRTNFSVTLICYISGWIKQEHVNKTDVKSLVPF